MSDDELFKGGAESEFYRMLRRALVNPNLNSTDCLIYAFALAERNNPERSNDRIAKLANVSVRSVKRAFVALKAQGLWLSPST